MTLMHFTLGAIPYHDPSKGTHIIHCWMDQSQPTRTDNPGDERKAAKDAKATIESIVMRNVDGMDDEQLLQDGTLPPDVLPVYTFAIGVCWDREAKGPCYKQIDFEFLCNIPKFAPVAPIGRDLYDHSFGVLKKYEKKFRTKAGLGKFKWDTITLEHGRRMFGNYCKNVKSRYAAHEVNRMRFECPKMKNGYCSPANPKCPCYCNGKCVEAKEVVL